MTDVWSTKTKLISSLSKSFRSTIPSTYSESMHLLIGLLEDGLR